VATPAPAAVNPAEADLLAKITAQGNVVRDLKTAKAAKADIDAGVAALKALKEEYKKLTGHDVPAAGLNNLFVPLSMTLLQLPKPRRRRLKRQRPRPQPKLPRPRRRRGMCRQLCARRVMGCV
jgi:hypothetical protein